MFISIFISFYGFHVPNKFFSYDGTTVTNRASSSRNHELTRANNLPNYRGKPFVTGGRAGWREHKNDYTEIMDLGKVHTV